MNPLIWSSLLLLVGLLLAVAEVFVPSGGLLGFLSIASMLSSIVLAFYHHGLETGLIFLSVTGVAVPIALIVAFRYWPHTPMGKRLLLELPKADDVLPDSPLRRKLLALVGKTGTAATVMLPSGAVQIDGMTVDAVSEGMAIEAGTRVRVIDVHGNRVLVQPADDEPTAARGEDLLNQSIESLGLDPFDEPLA